VKEVEGAPTPPPIELPKGPPPKRVVIKELRKGQGAPLRAAQDFRANYIAYEWGTGNRLERSWGAEPTWTWGTGQLVKGLEIGIKGMRVGGLRELLVPARFAFNTSARVYLVELVKVF
jgi:peptidylprolyl isomerase